jgi:hypothetical protein
MLAATTILASKRFWVACIKKNFYTFTFWVERKWTDKVHGSSLMVWTAIAILDSFGQLVPATQKKLPLSWTTSYSSLHKQFRGKSASICVWLTLVKNSVRISGESWAILSVFLSLYIYRLQGPAPNLLQFMVHNHALISYSPITQRTEYTSSEMHFD